MTHRIVDLAIYDVGMLNDMLTECRVYAAPDPVCEAGLAYPVWVDQTIYELIKLIGGAIRARAAVGLRAFEEQRYRPSQ